MVYVGFYAFPILVPHGLDVLDAIPAFKLL